MIRIPPKSLLLLHRIINRVIKIIRISTLIVRSSLLTLPTDVSFSCVVKSQRRWSNKIYKTELTKIRYKNQVLCKYGVDPQRAGLTLIAELTWSN